MQRSSTTLYPPLGESIRWPALTACCYSQPRRTGQVHHLWLWWRRVSKSKCLENPFRVHDWRERKLNLLLVPAFTDIFLASCFLRWSADTECAAYVLLLILQNINFASINMTMIHDKVSRVRPHTLAPLSLRTRLRCYRSVLRHMKSGSTRACSVCIT